MNLVLALEEMHRRFCDEWVLIENPETDEKLQILSGKVRCHSKNRDEVYHQSIDLKLTRFAIIYTGVSVDETAIVL
jgi:hypothetical protein